MGVFADIGIGAEGENRQLAAQDAQRLRELTIEQQQRRAEEEQRKLEEERRAERYLAEVRSVLPKYLAGGEQGVPEEAAREVAVPQPVTKDDEGNDLPAATRTVAGKPAQDNELGMLEAVKKIAVKHGRVADYEAMKKRVKTFQDEGLLDFIKQARSGADEDTLMDTFNKSGSAKLARLTKSPNPDEDGVYYGATKDGKPVRLDVDEMTTALLSPKDYVAHSDKEEATRARLEGNANTNAARVEATKARLAAEEALRGSRANANDALAEQRRARAAGGQSARTSGNWNQFDSQVKNLAQSRVTTVDADTGKTVIDRTAHVKLTSMASALGRQNPDLSPGEAVDQAAAKLDELRQIESDARTEAEDMAAKAPTSFKSQRDRQKWIDTTTKAIAARRASSAGGDSTAATAPKASAYQSPDDVKAAYHAGQITREQAKAELQRFGFQ